MSGEDQSESDVSGGPAQPKAEKSLADTIDENDPHKVEKLANAGKDTDVAEASE